MSKTRDIEAEAAEILAAEEAERYERARRQVLDRREAEQREAERQAARADALARLRSFDRTAVDEAYARLEEALTVYVAAANTYNADFWDLRVEMEALGLSVGGLNDRIDRPERTIRQESAKDQIAQAVVEALRAAR